MLPNTGGVRSNIYGYVFTIYRVVGGAKEGQLFGLEIQYLNFWEIVKKTLLF